MADVFIDSEPNTKSTDSVGTEPPHTSESINPQSSSAASEVNEEPAEQWTRSINLEQRSPCFCNIFFCFYFAYICRIQPISEEDVPVIAQSDNAADNTDILRSKWQPLYDAYDKEMLEFTTNTGFARICSISKRFSFQ